MGLTNNLGKLSNMITSTGSAVGIGTTSPADLLEVRGGFLRISATTGNSPQLNLYSNNQTNNNLTLAQGFATGSDNIGYLYNRANADFVFGTNNVERLRITSTGAVFYSNNGNQTNLLTYSSNQDKGITNFYQAQNFPSSNNYTRILDIVSSGDAIGGGAIRFLTSAANTAPATSMLITSGGNVGIGTTTPDIYSFGGNLLTLSSATTYSNIIIASSGTNSCGLQLGNQTIRRASIEAGNGSNLIFLTNNTNSGTNVDERMRITSTGNVGIGTSTPNVVGTANTLDGILNVYNSGSGKIYARGGGSGEIGFEDAGAGSGDKVARWLYDGGVLSFQRINDAFTAITSTPLTINSAGNVGIGTSSPGSRLEIAGGYVSLNDNAIRWRFASDANHATVFTATYNGPIMYGYSGAALGYQAIGVIWTSTTGAYNYNNSTTWQQTSDIRIKQNLRPITGALSKICSLNPTHFEYKNKLGKTKTGFIAQEFEQVFEGHVTETDPLPEYQEYFEEGEKIKSIDADLIPYLVKAIQELNERLNKAGL